jgi:hypothetical protein
MKTATIASPLLTSDNMESSVMGMDAVGMDLATYFMRDKIYSNKIKAVVREYLCNAIDEHNKFDVKETVQAGLRLENNEHAFYVRDFAKGLSEEDVRNIFGMYFRSTKSKSNDSIGGFGVGSKAGHCYNDTFFVTSYFNGKCTTYTCVLGAGDSGVPVGHIYKIDECDTNETGLEVSVPISSADYSDFKREIQDFIHLSPAKIEATIGNLIISPVETIKSFERNGFKFRLLNYGGSSSYKETIFQMGGVTYESSVKDKNFNIKRSHTLVIDIPIGMMSIPISRENFENTTANKLVLDKINKTIEELNEEDLAQFKSKSIFDLLDDCLSQLDNSLYTGEIFEARKSVLFKDVYFTLHNVIQINKEGNIAKKNNKSVILIAPNTGNYTYWLNKITNYCKLTGESYYFVADSDLNNKNTDVEKLKENFHIASVKIIKLPKTSNSKLPKTYSVYDQRGYKYPNQMTALEFHNYIRSYHNLPNANNEEEALVQNKELIENAKRFSEVLKFSICIKEGRNQCHQSNSHIFVKDMEKLGWNNAKSLKSKQLKESFDKIESEERVKEFARNSCMKRWVNFNSRTHDAIKKDKNAKKLNCFWEKLQQENSIRSKLVTSLGNYHYNIEKYSREDLRKILKMK